MANKSVNVKMINENEKNDEQKGKKKKFKYFESYISKVLKQTNPENGITNDAKQQMNSLLILLSTLISELAIKLTIMSNKRTLSVKEVENSIKILFSGELQQHAIKEGNKSIENFINIKKTEKGISRQNKAGIIFPPSVLEKYLRNFGHSNIMMTQKSPIFLASALEYICADILSVSCASAINKKKKRITVHDLEISMKNDLELKNILNRYNIKFLGGGNIPYIHPVLLKKRKQKKKTKKENNGDKKPHRYKPGTVSIREIKKYQKMGNTLIFAKLPFTKNIREILLNYRQNVKISKYVFILLQHYIEQYLVNILIKANMAAIHSGRVKLMPNDIEFIRSILENKKNMSYDILKDKEEINDEELGEELGEELDEDEELDENEDLDEDEELDEELDEDD